jgi:tetratricopeptide (TPR) repeat protein
MKISRGFRNSLHLVAVGKGRAADTMKGKNAVSSRAKGSISLRFHAGRYDEVLPLLGGALEIDPNFWVAHIVSAKICQFSEGNTEATALIGHTHARMACRTEAEEVLEELQLIGARRLAPPYDLATVYVGLGETEKALERLEKAYEERDVHTVFLSVEPKWNTLRSASRFQSLLRRVALL